MTLVPASSHPSGSSQPVTREYFSDFTGVSIGNGAAAHLPFLNSLGPNTLLSVTDPANPTVITAGVYAVSVDASPFAALTAGGWWLLRLALDSTGNEAPQLNAAANATVADQLPNASLSMTYYLPAGSTLYVEANNHDGVAARVFGINNVVVQRLA